MKKLTLLAGVLSIVASGMTALAIDRDAAAIDSIEARYRVFDKTDTAGVMVRGEIPLPFDQSWCLLANLGWSSILEDGVDENNMFHVSFGPKYYIAESTSIALLGQIDWTGTGTDFLAPGGGLMFEQRLISANSKISPYLQIGATYLNVGAAPWTAGAEDTDFTSWVGNIVLGSDIMLDDDSALVVRAEYWDSFKNSNDIFQDWAKGLAGSLGLKYYW